MRVNVTIPVFNEERCLSETIQRLHSFLIERLSFDWELVIANNGSTDRTAEIANVLERHYQNLTVLHSVDKGRGGAINRAWTQSKADILSYMDADLSTDLSAFVPLIESLIEGGYDLATGSRLLDRSLTQRGFKREFISQGYNRLIKMMLNTQFSDAQCGFKAISRHAARHLLPLIRDTGWFFDTELLVQAERHGFQIFDLPVCWKDNPDSHVNILKTAFDDLRGIWRLKRSR